IENQVKGTSFKVAPQCRPTVLYTGTHEGLIHAFRVDALNTSSGECAGAIPLQEDSDVGEELWAVIPQRLLKNTHGLVNRQPHLMDGQMNVSDVLLVRTDPLGKNAAAEATQWRSVLTAGYGIGGRGYISLDVSNALDGPKLMWEIDHQNRCLSGKCKDGASNSDSDFSKLGLTTGRPAYGTAQIGGAEVAIAVLGGGASPDDASNPEAGRVVYVVRLDDGSKIAELSNDRGNVVSMADKPAKIIQPITGNPAVFSNAPGVVSTRAFVGDAGGRLWRLDMSDNDPNDWKLQLFHDPYDQGPMATSNDTERIGVLGTPAIALANSSGHVAVLFGTGSLDFVSQGSVTRSGVISVSEVTSATGVVSSELNWTEVLESNQRLTGAPIVYAETAYFGSFAGDKGDACNAGSGLLFGLHFTDTESPGKAEPALDADGDATTLDLVRSVDLGDAIPSGIQVVQRPGCQVGGGAGGGGAGGGSSTAGDLDLVVNVSKGSGFSAKTVPPGVNG
ncbi:MAG: PilC/PilY family type IV pilus protein, partial [Myxococcota bacterium]|nr:PilC/PilY family type IV pilus protein [Myxococcota bacterium]